MDIRTFFFKNRSYTPIPLLLAVLILADPSWVSFGAGVGIAISGELVRLWAVAHAGSATRTTSGAGGDELIQTGPYAYMRNPLYLGNFLMTTGVCIAAWPWMPWMLLITSLLFLLQYGLIISLEEDYLQDRFPVQYRNYRTHVPRLFPRLTRYESGQEWNPSLKKALHSERSTLASFFTVSLLILVRWQLGG